MGVEGVVVGVVVMGVVIGVMGVVEGGGSEEGGVVIGVSPGIVLHDVP